MNSKFWSFNLTVSLFGLQQCASLSNLFIKDDSQYNQHVITLTSIYSYNKYYVGTDEALVTDIESGTTSLANLHKKVKEDLAKTIFVYVANESHQEIAGHYNKGQFFIEYETRIKQIKNR
ncbi:MAG: hypothetical protein JXB49_00980 [Bacteroidales bacterium]|nr:hypothetical protein [Bacteroidales bacterium]